MKKIFFGICIMCLIFTVGCSKNDVTQETRTIVDHAGNTVVIPNKVERVVVCDIYPLPSVISIFFDSAEKIVGMPAPSMSAAKNSLLGELYPEILNAKTNFIKDTEVNIEELIKLQPDVVFYSAISPALGQKLRDAGFNAIAISANKWEYNSIETLNNWIALLSEIFPENDKAKRVSDYSNKIYNMVNSRVKDLPQDKKKNVFFLFKYDDSMIMTSGKNFFGQWWAENTGAKNVAEELTKDNSVSVNMEQIYKWNPDIIFMTNFTTAKPSDLYENKVGNFDWSGVLAVTNKQVYKMPLGMYRSYTAGVDTPVTLLWLAKSTYPELFSDVDITGEVIKYYKDVFQITLSKSQVDRIFEPKTEAGGME